MKNDQTSTAAAVPDYQTAFTTLHTETTLPKLDVEGAFPAWLDGALLRNGPAMFETDAAPLNHQFDGPAMFHRFGFANGEVSYMNRYCRSSMYAYIKENGALGHFTFGTAVTQQVAQRLLAEIGRGAAPHVNPNVTFTEINGHLLATTDGSTIPIKIDPATLETQGLLVWDDALQTQDSAGNKVGQWQMRGTTGHWHRHPVDGSAINYFYQSPEAGRAGSYNFFRVRPGTEQREPIASVPTDQAAMIHAFSVTARYLVLPEAPLRIDQAMVQSGVSVARSMQWRESSPMLLHVVDIENKKLVRTFEVRPCYVMHTINAYEDGDDIVLDMAVYDDAEHVWELSLDPSGRPPGGIFPDARAAELRSHAKPCRFRLDMRTGTAREDLLADVCVELPTFDYGRRNGRKYGQFYATGISDHPDARFYNQLTSLNVESGKFKTFAVDGHYLGEPFFVGRPDRASETDGVLLSVGLDTGNQRSYLLALDPASLEPFAKAFLPHHIPSGFHGHFIRGGAR